MIYFIIFINGFTWGYILYQNKVIKPVKHEMDIDYVNGLIDKALLETELN
jgi:hypothetical protein